MEKFYCAFCGTELIEDKARKTSSWDSDYYVCPNCKSVGYVEPRDFESNYPDISFVRSKNT